jgi:hypothetical protein
MANVSRLTYEGLCSSSLRELDVIFAEGTMPPLDQLAGWEFRGYNVSPIAELIRARKFKKGFYRDREGGTSIRGYNVKVKQNGLLNPWIDVIQDGEPVRHGLYEVRPARPGERDAKHPHALLLDYGRGGNPPYDPSQALRDYLVQVYADNPDLHLGKAYGALGPLRVPLGYFVLERYNEAL